MGGFVQLHTGDGAAGIFCAEQMPQGTAAGAQIQNLCLLWQSDKTGQQHRIGAQGKCPRWQLQGKAVIKSLHGDLRHKK